MDKGKTISELNKMKYYIEAMCKGIGEEYQKELKELRFEVIKTIKKIEEKVGLWPQT